MADHVSTVSGIYQAFGTGDVGWILDQLADDVAWEHGIRDTGLPWLVPGTGKDHVLSFFQALGSGVAFDVFEPGPICDGGDTVIAAVREAGTVLATGRRIEEDVFVHIWKFGADGKITSFRHVGDFARHELAALSD
jgi:uncharacterized protein